MLLCLWKIMEKMLFAGCADNSNCPGFDSLCNPLDHSNCSFCDNNNCTAGEHHHHQQQHHNLQYILSVKNIPFHFCEILLSIVR